MNSKKETQFPYLHGFTEKEQERLRKQARFAEHTVYKNVNFSHAKHILEVGSGVGAQSEILLRRFPELKITGIDLSDQQLETAKRLHEKNPFSINRIQFEKMDASKMRFQGEEFDGAFLCWILEHVPDPLKVLSEVRRVVRPGGSVVITEVMNSSFFLNPYSPNVWKYWMAFNDYQYDNAGDPFVGAKLGNFLMQVGFQQVETEVITWHLDNRHPQKRKEFIDYWTELLLSASEQLVKAKYVTEDVVEQMKNEMDKVSSDPNAVFLYSFMQAKAKV